MEFLPVSEEAILRAAAVLSQGGLVAFPTETVYGLGCDAFNPAALARVFEVKNRPRFDPLIIHIACLEALEKLADLSALDGAARKKVNLLTEKLWPGPLTLILPKQRAVPDLATSGLSTAAVRFPAHQAAQKLIAGSTGAIAAPSANPFGYLSPSRAEHVRDQLGGKVDIILDGGPAEVGVESTVLDITGEGLPRILRPGGTPREVIEAIIGETAKCGAAASGTGAVMSPGQLKSHYAPRTPLSLHTTDSLPDISGEKSAALIFFDAASRDSWRAACHGTAATVRVLSETGNPLEAAARLFETLHELDRSGVSRIYAQAAPEAGLGAAINDRLRRASAI